MRRILVVGCSGAGKSTLSRRLGEALGLPVVHLDVAYWRPGWRSTPDDEFDRTVARLVAEPRWVMDGNYARSLDVRLREADTVIHLDFARWRCVWGIVRRVLLARLLNRPRPDMAEGCGEQWDWEFVEWVWDFRRTERVKTLGILERHAGRVRAVTLRTRAEVRAFLQSLGDGAQATETAAVAIHSAG